MEFDAAYTAQWIRAFAASVAATEDELTDFDQRAGDGDFGVNLRAGLESATAGLDRRRPGEMSAHGPLEVAAGAFLDDVGGTSGPLFGLLLAELAAAVAEDGDLVTVRALAAGAESGLAAIRRVGEASPGDKTLVDALAPAATVLRGFPPGTPPDHALATAAEAAWEGVRATAMLRARRGRASYLGERASGIPDPGAVGIGLLFSAAAGPVTSVSVLLCDAEVGQAPR